MIYNSVLKLKFFRNLARIVNFMLSKLDLKLSLREVDINDFEVDLCIDVGANTGQYGLMLIKSGFKGKIVSIEAQPKAHSELVDVSAKFANWLVTDSCAVGDCEGEIIFQIAGNSFSSSALNMNVRHIDAAPESAPIGTISVKQYKLETVLDKYLDLLVFNTIYLKLDTQGYEKNILYGISDDLWRKIKYVELELSLIELYDGQALFGFYIDYMKERNFVLIKLKTEFSDLKTNEILQLNGVFKFIG
jgi:FkbM family methyltransferase